MPYYADTQLSPHFNLLVGVDSGAVIFCHTYDSRDECRQILDLERKFFPDLSEDKAALNPIITRLNHYFSGGDTDPAGMDVRFSRGTAFERKIWSTLREIKKGDTISYQQLGEKAEFPRSQRAVGGAMGRNYLLLFVPCHRVISKTNGLGGFSAGIKKKEFLLKLEDIF